MGVKDIRVSFDDNRGRIGFRYGNGWLSCIISVEYRFWLVAQKTNVVALELVSFRAGALPLGTQALLDFITETARQQNIDVTWYRHDGHPVALLQFQANQPRPNTLLRKLELKSGRSRSRGESSAGPRSRPLIAPTPFEVDAIDHGSSRQRVPFKASLNSVGDSAMMA